MNEIRVGRTQKGVIGEMIYQLGRTFYPQHTGLKKIHRGEKWESEL